MCMSRLHRVLRSAGPGAVDVEDVDGTVHRVSLLALDGPAPAAGRVARRPQRVRHRPGRRAEAEAVATELRLSAATAGGAVGDEAPT